MKKQYRELLSYIIMFLIIILLLIIFSHVYHNFRVKHAHIDIDLGNTNVEVYSKIKTSDLINSINGELVEDNYINTSVLGKKEINFQYINEENIKIPYSFEINIVDTTNPSISWNNITAYIGDKNFIDNTFCGDNYDDKPKCYIDGEYDINTPGTYPVTYVSKDSSGNVSKRDINLIVKEKPKKVTNTSSTYKFTSYTPIEDVISYYKKKDNQIGIDVSKWDKEINYKKVKESKVEFVMIKLGGRDGLHGDLYLDPNYKKNIEGFTKENLPVGVYFYSHASNKEEAIEEAKFVIKNIKKYKIDLPIAFDWENFNTYKKYNMSFHTLNEVADSFLKHIESKGYEPMLYGSKYHLETYWENNKYKTWLAHYVNETNYQGKYYMWQLRNDGRVNGIDQSVVDINVMYKKTN